MEIDKAVCVENRVVCDKLIAIEQSFANRASESFSERLNKFFATFSRGKYNAIGRVDHRRRKLFDVVREGKF